MLVTYRGVDFIRFPLLSMIFSIFFLRRWRQSHLRDFHHPQGFQKPPQQRPFVEFRKFRRYLVMFWFCNILSCSVHIPMFSHTSFSRRPKSNAYTSLRILPRFLSLWLLFRRALCQRRPRRRVGCSGQAVPCLVLRRFQPAVLVYMRSFRCMLINGHPCWLMVIMLINGHPCWL